MVTASGKRDVGRARAMPSRPCAGAIAVAQLVQRNRHPCSMTGRAIRGLTRLAVGPAMGPRWPCWNWVNVAAIQSETQEGRPDEKTAKKDDAKDAKKE